MEILLAGDNFIRNDILEAAMSPQLRAGTTFSKISLSWPQIPFGPVAEVAEASGTEGEVGDAIGTAEVVVTQMAPLTARVLERAPSLRLVVCTRGGPVNVNMAAAADLGIAVSCTPGRNAVAAAEYTVLLILAALRRLPAAHISLANGEWRSGMYDYEECGRELAGSVVGVVGFGEIGRRVSGLVRALGARVLVHDPFVTRDDAGADVELVSLGDLVGRADIVTLHARLTTATENLIGADELARMRPGAVLVNTARGGLLDYDAAMAALESGALGALAVDVFPEEPVPAGSALLTSSNIVLSPHLAGATRQTAMRAATIAAAEVERYVRQQPLLHTVNGIDVGARP